MKNEIRQITIRKETLLKSILSDIFTFGCIGFLFWFNYSFIGGSYLVNAIIMFMILTYICKLACSFKEGSDPRLISRKGVSDEKIDKIVKILDE